MRFTPSTALGLLLIGFLTAGIIFVAVELIMAPPGAPFPSWRQPAVSPTSPAPTPTALPAARPLRSATQGASS